MTLSEYLSESLNLILDEQDWIQGTMARTRSGALCSPRSPRAACFCASGALRRVFYLNNLSENLYDDAHLALGRTAHRFYGYLQIEDVNDYVGHDAVVGCFEAAIAVA